MDKTDRQTDRQIDRQIDGQMDRQMDRQIDISCRNFSLKRVSVKNRINRLRMLSHEQELTRNCCRQLACLGEWTASLFFSLYECWNLVVFFFFQCRRLSGVAIMQRIRNWSLFIWPRQNQKQSSPIARTCGRRANRVGHDIPACRDIGVWKISIRCSETYEKYEYALCVKVLILCHGFFCNSSVPGMKFKYPCGSYCSCTVLVLVITFPRHPDPAETNYQVPGIIFLRHSDPV